LAKQDNKVTKKDLFEAEMAALSPEMRASVERARKWMTDPLLWVEDFFGDNIREASERGGFEVTTRTGLTEQQENGLVELGKLIAAKLKVSKKGKRLTDEEKKYAKKIGISIMSGKGTGKDFFSALVSMYFLTVFENSKGLGTANTGKQLKNVFWSELAKIMSLAKKVDPTNPKSKTVLEDVFEWQSEKIFWKEKKGKQWFMEAATVNPNASSEEQAKALTGRHEDYMIFVIDEAIGVPEPALMALEDTMTGKLNIAVMIFNPFRSKGYAIDSQYKDSEKWVALRWNAEDCERVTKESIEIKKAYGVESNTYRVSVLGLPPIADVDTLIPWDWIQDAIGRELEIPAEYPFIKGGDFGAGGDKSVICTRKGGQVYPFKCNNTQDSNALVDWVVNDFNNAEAAVFFGDVIGIGWGVMGTLRKEIGGHKARSVDSRSKAMREDRFVNKRAEMFWTLREKFENNEISIPDNEALIDQLSVLKKKEDNRGRIQIIKKSEIKKELKEGNSPDEADSLAMTYAFPDERYMKVKDEDDELEPGRRRRRPSYNTGTENAFLYV
jgi:hypothetical protein